MTSDIDIKEVAPQLVFRWRGRVAMSDIARQMDETYGAMVPHMNAQGVQFAGPPMTIYHDSPQADGTVDMEICLPIDRELSPLGDMSSRVVEGGQVAATIHKGPYDELHAAYTRLEHWIEANGYEPVAGARESYLTDPGEVQDPANYLTELAWPVRKKE